MLAELVVELFWPSEPISFFEFLEKQKSDLNSSEIWREACLPLYGKDASSILLACLSGEKTQAPQDAAYYIWRGWPELQPDISQEDLDEKCRDYTQGIRDKNLLQDSACFGEDYNDPNIGKGLLVSSLGWDDSQIEHLKKYFQSCFNVSKKWHKHLLENKLFQEAFTFEQRCLSHCPIEWRKEFRFILPFKRLSSPLARSRNKDKIEWIVSAFRTNKSFLETGLSTEQVQDFIRTTLELCSWQYPKNYYFIPDKELLSQEVDSKCITTYLPLLWYSSPYRSQWLVALKEYLQQAEVSVHLHALSYLIKIKKWQIGGIGTLPFVKHAELLELSEELPVLQLEKNDHAFFLKELYGLGDSFQKRELRMSSEELIDWLELAYVHSSEFGFEKSNLVPFADKVLAFIRKDIQESPNDFDVEKIILSIQVLLTFSPEKMLGNLLRTFRCSDHPCSSEGLEYGAGRHVQYFHNSQEEKHLPDLSWVSLLISNCLRKGYLFSDDNADEYDHQIKTSQKVFAEYCWKSLRLKKDQKVEGEYYTSSQCTEDDPFWRQGFIKALSEMRLDLGGKVHKLLFFIRKHDPEPDVRKFAKEAYKLVRHQSTPNITKPINGLLIAFWWLRLAQRRALKLDVDPTLATKTRRNELRNAMKINDIQSLIFS